MLEPLRLVTIHPALVHFPLGVLPVAVIAYAGAAYFRSERWTFAGDLAIWIGGLAAAAALSFGLVSNALLFWPGGLEGWRWVHLGFACFSTLWLLGIGVVRLRRRALQPTVGWRTLGATLVVAAALSFTGWIGGEILVFHGGMAVKAAANGALSPPLHAPAEKPANLLAGMAAVRSEWAAAATATAEMVVHQPSPRAFTAAANGAAHLRTLTLRIRELGVSAGHPGPEFASLAAQIGARAEAVAQAASAQDPARLAEAVGQLTSACARCHDDYRW